MKQGDPAQGGAGSGDLPLWRRLAITGGSGLATLVALLIVVMLGFLWAFFGSGPSARHDQSTTVVLRPGAGITEIASDLEHAGVVRSAIVFMVASKVGGSGRHLMAGEYEFPSRASMASVMDKLAGAISSTT